MSLVVASPKQSGSVIQRGCFALVPLFLDFFSEFSEKPWNDLVPDCADGNVRAGQGWVKRTQTCGTFGHFRTLQDKSYDL